MSQSRLWLQCSSAAQAFAGRLCSCQRQQHFFATIDSRQTWLVGNVCKMCYVVTTVSIVRYSSCETRAKAEGLDSSSAVATKATTQKWSLPVSRACHACGAELAAAPASRAPLPPLWRSDRAGMGPTGPSCPQERVHNILAPRPRSTGRWQGGVRRHLKTRKAK